MAKKPARIRRKGKPTRGETAGKSKTKTKKKQPKTLNKNKGNNYGTEREH